MNTISSKISQKFDEKALKVSFQKLKGNRVEKPPSTIVKNLRSKANVEPADLNKESLNLANK